MRLNRRKRAQLEMNYFPRNTSARFKYQTKQGFFELNHLKKQEQHKVKHLHYQNPIHDKNSSLGVWQNFMDRTSKTGHVQRFHKDTLSYKRMKDNMRTIRTILPDHPYA